MKSEEFAMVSYDELTELSELIYDQCPLFVSKRMKDEARAFITSVFVSCNVNDVRKVLFRINDDLGYVTSSREVTTIWNNERKKLMKKTSGKFSLLDKLEELI